MSVRAGTSANSTTLDASNRGQAFSEIVTATGDGAPIVVSAEIALLEARFAHGPAGDLVIEGPGGARIVIEGYFDLANPPTLMTESGAALAPDLVAALAGPLAPGQYAASGAGIEAPPIGRVSESTGEVAATRVDGTRVELGVDSPIYEGDVLETEGGAAVTITFVDESVFSLGEEARMVLDELVFDPSSMKGSSTFSVIQGVFVFVSGEIAANNPDDMIVRTPVATLGVRGTHVGGEAAPEGELNTIVLFPKEGAPDEPSGAVTYQTQGAELAGEAPMVIDQPFQAASVASVFDKPSGFDVSPSEIAGLFGQVAGALTGTTMMLEVKRAIDHGDSFDGAQQDSGSSADQLAQISPAAGEGGAVSTNGPGASTDSLVSQVLSAQGLTGDLADAPAVAAPATVAAPVATTAPAAGPGGGETSQTSGPQIVVPVVVATNTGADDGDEEDGGEIDPGFNPEPPAGPADAVLVHAWELDASVNDTFGGPNMFLPDPSGLGASGYRFDFGEGPNVSNAIDPFTYSIEMAFSIDETVGFRKIIDFENQTSDAGLYNLNQHLNFYPVTTGEEDVFEAGDIVHLVATRDDESGAFTGYVDGVEQISFTDFQERAVFDGPDSIIHFLIDDFITEFSENTGGFLDFVRIYDGVISSDEAGDLFAAHEDGPGVGDFGRGEFGGDGLNGPAFGNDGGFGGEGFNEIFGTPGDDLLLGTADFDLLFGGTGIDTLLGGASFDVFGFQSPADGVFAADGTVAPPTNRIEDFETGLDEILITSDFGIAGQGLLPASKFATVSGYDGTNSGFAPNESHFVFDPEARTLYHDSDSGSSGYSALFTVQEGASVSATDIGVADIQLGPPN